MRWWAPAARSRKARCFRPRDFAYPLSDLLGDTELVRYYRGGQFATLRLTSSMYHRFHAPYDCRVEQVNYISGDTWNVNPIALKRIERLFCKNERAIIRCRLAVGRADHPGAGRRHFGRQHSPQVSRRAAAPPLSGTESHSLRRSYAQRRGDGLVRAWLDHHRVRAARNFSLPGTARGRLHTDGPGADAKRPALQSGVTRRRFQGCRLQGPATRVAGAASVSRQWRRAPPCAPRRRC